MTITIPPDNYPIWEHLTLSVPQTLTFALRRQYLLVGDNGAGKSSFIKRVFIPAFERQADQRLFLWYVSQDFLMQFYAIKAHAAFNRNFRGEIHTHAAALAYMFDCYASALTGENGLVAVFDETEAFASLAPMLQQIAGLRAMTLLITHQREMMERLPQAERLEFRKTAARASEARLRQGGA